MDEPEGDLIIDAREEVEGSDEPLHDQAVAGDETAEAINPEELPPELQEHFKRMQASHTKKMQAVAERERELQGLDIDELKQAQRHLNRIMTDPDYRDQVLNGVAGSQRQQSSKSDAYEPVYFKGEMQIEEQEKNLFKELAMEAIREQVLPLAQQLIQRQNNVERTIAQDNWSSVVNENPNAKKHLDKVSDMLQKVPGLGDYFASQGMSQKEIFSKLVQFAAPEAVQAPKQSNGSPPQKREVAQEDRQRAQLTGAGVAPASINSMDKKGSMFDRNNLMEILRTARGG